MSRCRRCWSNNYVNCRSTAAVPRWFHRTHNLAVVRSIAQDVVVLSDGVIVEHGLVDQVLDHPAHGYTQRLLADLPSTGVMRAVSERWTSRRMHASPQHPASVGATPRVPER